ncbi:His/Gly/Thr/Pro-type tRNA ligase C-terminal domain-containing protein [Nonomuraea sp. NPDC050790]|uniref:His/Gly/Thr/Pro-type tRNA ligase C-terminal domain-containing protein n=1 Tax=Nonomuraea sp. NPDC050790 TaxID=3364371 RepID=UPI0037A8BD27
MIVPIGRGEEVPAAARELAGGLKAAGVRAHVDDRDHLSPGYRFNDWEPRSGSNSVRTRAAGTWEAFADAGWASALHCGRAVCEDDIKADAYGKRVLFGRSC